MSGAGDAEIARAEGALGAVLPTGLKSVWVQRNGCDLTLEDVACGDYWRLFPVRDERSRKALGRTAVDIVVEQQGAKQWSGFPVNALAIASNDSGDFLVLLKTGASFGETVYLWDHESTDLVEVAGTILEFEVAG